MNARHALLTAIAAAHLLVVACGAASWAPFSDKKLPGKALRWYGGMSGANNGYGFFASVGPSYRVSFTMTNSTGRTWTDVLDQGKNNEATLRFNGTVSILGYVGDGLTASWAATMFGRHPDAQQVVVELNEYDPPSMEDYQAGKRAQWERVYEAMFVRNEAIPSAEER
jgi:hypothetical protein